jgi:hypothetical protein
MLFMKKSVASFVNDRLGRLNPAAVFFISFGSFIAQFDYSSNVSLHMLLVTYGQSRAEAGLFPSGRSGVTDARAK